MISKGSVMKTRTAFALALLLPILSVGFTERALAQQADEHGFVIVHSDAVKWETDLGLGVMSAIIQGDPSKPGIYVQRIKFPPYTFSRPHVHLEGRHITVIKGTWYVGTGEKWDPKSAVPLTPGSYMKHRPKKYIGMERRTARSFYKL
jgi:hypothetical protein